MASSRIQILLLLFLFVNPNISLSAMKTLSNDMLERVEGNSDLKNAARPRGYLENNAPLLPEDPAAAPGMSPTSIPSPAPSSDPSSDRIHKYLVNENFQRLLQDMNQLALLAQAGQDSPTLNSNRFNEIWNRFTNTFDQCTYELLQLYKTSESQAIIPFLHIQKRMLNRINNFNETCNPVRRSPGEKTAALPDVIQLVGDLREDIYKFKKIAETCTAAP